MKQMIDNNYISTLVENYIDFKRGLGFELKNDAQRLRSFVSHTRSTGYTGYITKDIALKWFCIGTESSKTRGRRLETLSPFLKYTHVKNKITRYYIINFFPM